MMRATLYFRSATVLAAGSTGPDRCNVAFDMDVAGARHRDCIVTLERRTGSDEWEPLGPVAGYVGPQLEPPSLALACSTFLNLALRSAAIAAHEVAGVGCVYDAPLPRTDVDFSADLGLAGPGAAETGRDGGAPRQLGVSTLPGSGVRGRVAQGILRLYQAWNERFPGLRGRSVLLDLVRALTRAGAPSPVVAGDEGILLGFGRDFVTMTVATSGTFEPLLSRRLHALTPPGGVWIDVGANVGYVSMLAARWVGPRGRVYSFEPARETFERLRANLARNNVTNVIPFNLGCSSSTGEVELVVPGEDLGRSHVAHGTERGERIAIVTLDSHFAGQPLDRLDFLKVDVEGHDLEVVKGARQLLQRWRPPVLLEVGNVPDRSLQESILDAHDVLEPLGYRCELLAHDSAYDLLFLPKS